MVLILKKDQELDEWIKCAEDPVYFIGNYCKVAHQKHGIILMKDYLYPKQIELLKTVHEKNFTIVNKTRQCLTKDNFVMTNRGYISIKDVKIGDKIETLINNEIKFVDVLDAFHNGKKEIVRISTNSGSEINCTLDHKIFTKRGWVEAGNLTLNDEIVSIINSKKFGNYKLEKDEYAALIGYYLSDGRSNAPTFVNTNIDYINKVMEIGKTFENCFPYIYKRKDKRDGRIQAYDVRLVSNTKNNRINRPFLDFMKKHCLNFLSENRILTFDLINLNKRQMSILLNRLYAGDGWFTYKKDKRRKNYIQYEIGIGSPSFKLIKQIEYILQTKYGIHGYITETKDKRNPNGKRFWKFRVCQKKSVINFINEIGIKGKTDTKEIIQLISKENPYETNQSIEKIRKIQRINKCENVYDITTESSNFLTNGLLVHNCGASTILAAYCLWTAMFNENKNIIVISRKDAEAKNFKRVYIDDVYSRLPDFLKSKRKTESKLYKNTHETFFDTGSVIKTEAGPVAGRGSAAYIILCDEAGFIDNIEDVWSAAYPTLSTGGGKAIINSTSSAMGTWYADQWYKSLAGETDFTPVVIEWSDVPHFKNEKGWLEKQERNLTPHSKFRREVLREFIIEGDTYIPQESINKIETREPIRSDFLLQSDVIDIKEALNLPLDGFDDTKNYIKGLWIWKEPEQHDDYMIGVDVSSGLAKDQSTIQVVNVRTREQVAEYRGKVDNNKLAIIAYKLGRYYNNGFVAVEYNNMGSTVFNELDYHLKYENLYWRADGKPGWVTSTNTRDLILNALYKNITHATIKSYSTRLKQEIQNLVSLNGKVQAAQGTNDDLVMAFSIALYLLEDFSLLTQAYNIKYENDFQNEDDYLEQTTQSIRKALELANDGEIAGLEEINQHRWML